MYQKSVNNFNKLYSMIANRMVLEKPKTQNHLHKGTNIPYDVELIGSSNTYGHDIEIPSEEDKFTLSTHIGKNLIECPSMDKRL